MQCRYYNPKINKFLEILCVYSESSGKQVKDDLMIRYLA